MSNPPHQTVGGLGSRQYTLRMTGMLMGGTAPNSVTIIVTYSDGIAS